MDFITKSNGRLSIKIKILIFTDDLRYSTTVYGRSPVGIFINK